MKKFVTIVCTLALSGALAFAQADKPKTDTKPADAPKTETKAKKHKHHKASKKAKKGSSDSSTTGTSNPK